MLVIHADKTCPLKAHEELWTDGTAFAIFEAKSPQPPFNWTIVSFRDVDRWVVRGGYEPTALRVVIAACRAQGDACPA